MTDHKFEKSTGYPTTSNVVKLSNERLILNLNMCIWKNVESLWNVARKNKQSYTTVMAIEKGVINATLSIAFTFFHIQCTSLVFAFKERITRYKNSKLISKQIPWNASTHKWNLNCNLHGICIGLALEWQCSILSILYFLSIKINLCGHF